MARNDATVVPCNEFFLERQRRARAHNEHVRYVLQHRRKLDKPIVVENADDSRLERSEHCKGQVAADKVKLDLQGRPRTLAVAEDVEKARTEARTAKTEVPAHRRGPNVARRGSTVSISRVQAAKQGSTLSGKLVSSPPTIEARPEKSSNHQGESEVTKQQREETERTGVAEMRMLSEAQLAEQRDDEQKIQRERETKRRIESRVRRQREAEVKRQRVAKLKQLREEGLKRRRDAELPTYRNAKGGVSRQADIGTVNPTSNALRDEEGKVIREEVSSAQQQGDEVADLSSGEGKNLSTAESSSSLHDVAASSTKLKLEPTLLLALDTVGPARAKASSSPISILSSPISPDGKPAIAHRMKITSDVSFSSAITDTEESRVCSHVVGTLPTARRVAKYWLLRRAREGLSMAGLLAPCASLRDIALTSAAISSEVAKTAGSLALRALASGSKPPQALLGCFFVAAHHRQALLGTDDDEVDALVHARRLTLCLQMGSLSALYDAWQGWVHAIAVWNVMERDRVTAKIISDSVATEALRIWLAHSFFAAADVGADGSSLGVPAWEDPITKKQDELRKAIFHVGGDRAVKALNAAVARARGTPMDVIPHETLAECESFVTHLKQPDADDTVWVGICQDLRTTPMETDALFSALKRIEGDINAIRSSPLPSFSPEQVRADLKFTLEFISRVEGALLRLAGNDDLRIWIYDAECRLRTSSDREYAVMEVLRELTQRVSAAREAADSRRIFALASQFWHGAAPWQRSRFEERAAVFHLLTGGAYHGDVDAENENSDSQVHSGRSRLYSSATTRS